MGQLDAGEIGRGKTIYGPVNAIDTNNLVGADLLGIEKWFTDTQNVAGAPQTRSKRKILCRLVRNSSSINLLPKRGVSFKVGTLGTEVDGYTRTTAQGDYAVTDEYLPSGGVRPYDVFWVVVAGPAMVTTTLAADATNVIGQGDLLVAATAAASTGTTAGRFEVFAIDAASQSTAELLNIKEAMNALGRAQSAKTTGNTGVDILVDVMYHK